MTDMFKGDDAGLHLEFRSADRAHVPDLEPRAYNQMPKTSEHGHLKLYRYGETDLYQWWSRKNGSVFDDPCDEPFVIIGATDGASLVKGDDRNALACRVANRRQGQSSTPRCEEPGQADIDSARRLVDLVLDEAATLPPNAEYLLRSGLKARNIDVTGTNDPVTAALVAISHYQAERAGNPLASVASVEVASPPVGGAGGWRPDREAGAKIIRREMENNTIPAIERSLRAIDAILALAPAPSPTEGA